MLEDAFLWMLNCTLRGSLLLLYIMGFRLLVRKASRKWCYILWGLGWFRLVCPWTPPFLRYHNALLPRVDWFQKELLTGETADVALNATIRGDVTTRFRLPVTGGQMATYLQIAAIVWAAGVIVLLALGVASYLRLNRRVRHAELVQAGDYPVYRCDAVTVPFSMGVFRKRVYLPPGLTELEEEMVIAHEKTHLSRNDPLWKLVISLIRTLHWINPLVWLAFRLWGADMEYTCDERVFQWLGKDKKPEYCRALMTVSQKPYAFCPVAFAEGGVKGRVKNLLKPRKHLILWGLLAGYLILDLFVLGMTEASGIDIAAKSVDPALISRLDSALQWMRENPDRVQDMGFFDQAELEEVDMGKRREQFHKMAELLNVELTEAEMEKLAGGSENASTLKLLAHRETEDFFGNLNIELALEGDYSPLFPSKYWSSGTIYRLDVYTSHSDALYHSDTPYEWSYSYVNDQWSLGVMLFSRELWPNRAEQMLEELVGEVEAARAEGFTTEN